MLSELSFALIPGSACAGRTWRTKSHKRVLELLHSYDTRQRVQLTHLLVQTRCEGPGICISFDQSHKQPQQTAQTLYEISELAVFGQAHRCENYGLLYPVVVKRSGAYSVVHVASG